MDARPIKMNRPMPLVRCIGAALRVAESGEKSNKEMAGICRPRDVAILLITGRLGSIPGVCRDILGVAAPAEAGLGMRVQDAAEGKMELQDRLLLGFFVVLLAIVGSQYPVLGGLLP